MTGMTALTLPDKLRQRHLICDLPGGISLFVCVSPWRFANETGHSIERKAPFSFRNFH